MELEGANLTSTERMSKVERKQGLDLDKTERKYLLDYLEYIDTLPDEIQRSISQMRVLDIEYRGYMQEAESTLDTWLGDNPSSQSQLCNAEPTDGSEKLERMHLEKTQNNIHRKLAFIEASKLLMKAQNIADEKIQLSETVKNYIDSRARQLNLDKNSYEKWLELELEKRKTKDPDIPVLAAQNDATGSKSQRTKKAKYGLSLQSSSSLDSSIPEVISFVSSCSHSETSWGESTKTAESMTRSSQDSFTVSANTENQNVSDAETPNSPFKDLRFLTRTTEKAKAIATRNSGSDAGSAAVGNQVEPLPLHIKVGRASETSSAATAMKTPSATPKKKSPKPQTSVKKRRGRKPKTSQTNDATSVTEDTDDLDPEPLYCLCEKVSDEKMVACDNELCPIEWYHFSCVGLFRIPKGKWYCPKCRAGKPNVMKSKSVFLKELDKYNREKEEKASPQFNFKSN